MLCPLGEPCVEQAALCCSLFIYVYNTGISVFWVLGTYTTLHLQSLFLLTITKERESCPAFMNTSVCFENYFHLPQLFPLQFKDWFFFCSLCWDIQFPEVLFLSLERKLVLHMKGIGKSCQSKLVQKVLAVMLHSKHTVESLWGTSVLQVAEFIANTSSRQLCPLLWAFSASQPTNGLLWKICLGHNLP